jgi:MFS family permease
MAAGYMDILRTRHAARLLVSTLMGRLPNATASFVVLLFVRSEGGSYSLAGGLAAVFGVASAAGQPVLGRLVDLYGQLRVQLPAALVSALCMVIFALVGTDVLPVAYAAAAVGGLSVPPLEGGLRALWPTILSDERDVHTVYAMDAVAQEVMFTAGPLLVSLCVSLWSARAAVLVVNGIGVLGAVSVLVSRPSRAWRSAPREAHWLGALRSPGLLALLGAFLFVGVALGAIAVAGVSYADGHGGEVVYGWLMAGVGFGALLGGAGYGARQWTGEPERRLVVLVALLAVGYVPLLVMPGAVAMTGLMVLAGVFLAPAVACAFVVVDHHAPRGTVTEAFSWLVTTFTVGGSLGSAVAGPVVEWGGAGRGFAVPGCAGAVAVLVLLATRRALAATRRVPAAGVVAENDRNGAPEAGFSARHQA